jgi:hypothetical protein
MREGGSPDEPPRLPKPLGSPLTPWLFDTVVVATAGVVWLAKVHTVKSLVLTGLIVQMSVDASLLHAGPWNFVTITGAEPMCVLKLEASGMIVSWRSFMMTLRSKV